MGVANKGGGALQFVPTFLSQRLATMVRMYEGSGCLWSYSLILVIENDDTTLYWDSMLRFTLPSF